MKNMSTTAKVIWGIVIAVVIYLIYKMINKPAPSSSTGTSTGSGFTITNPNAGNTVSTQSYNPSTPTSKNPIACAENCAMGDIACVLRCLSANVPSEEMAKAQPMINKLQIASNSFIELNKELANNMLRVRTQGDVLRAKQTYLTKYGRVIQSLNDSNFNPIMTAINNQIIDLRNKARVTNADYIVLSAQDKERLKSDIIVFLSKYWKCMLALIGGGFISGALTGIGSLNPFVIISTGITGAISAGVAGNVGCDKSAL